MIEIKGARLVFYGQDGNAVATMDVPVKLELYGRVILTVDDWEVPAAARAAVKYQVLLPMPVLYEASEITVMLASQILPMPEVKR